MRHSNYLNTGELAFGTLFTSPLKFFQLKKYFLLFSTTLLIFFDLFFLPFFPAPLGENFSDSPTDKELKIETETDKIFL